MASRGIDAPVYAVDIDTRPEIGALAIPKDIDRVGWWRDGAAPGDARGTILLAGHIDSAKRGAGAFYGLKSARRGDTISVSTDDGKLRTYRVSTVRRVRKAALPGSIYTRSGPRRLVLVTCGGPFDEAHRPLPRQPHRHRAAALTVNPGRAGLNLTSPQVGTSLRAMRKFTVVGAVIVALLQFASTASAATTRFVDDDHKQCPQATFTKIQAAIDASRGPRPRARLRGALSRAAHAAGVQAGALRRLVPRGRRDDRRARDGPRRVSGLRRT